MTVLLAVVLLGLGVLFGVIFWENEEGIGVFSLSLGGCGESVVGEGGRGSRWGGSGIVEFKIKEEGLTEGAPGHGV